jgi:DNA invertase Pin-like site-specific DNA recombinase
MTKTNRFSAITSPMPKAMTGEVSSPAASLYRALSQDDGSSTDESRMRAAQYVRMSTERQDFSIETQVMANAAYAATHGLNVVRTYTDSGLSGLSIEKRHGLKALLADVMSGAADYSVILVYDVSRWGRFQNIDEAAHYEFLCTEAGVRVDYCAEEFDNDGSPTSALLKHIKRAMAAEYSRDLSQKVSRAQRGLQARGYWMGGAVPFGFQQQIEDEHGNPCPKPDGNVWKKRQGLHSRLVHGAPEDVELVRRLFKMYLRRGATIASVSRQLTREGLVSNTGRPWSEITIARILQNEIYTGRKVAGRFSRKVGSAFRTPIPKDKWIVVEGVAPAIISRATFDAVCRKRARLRRSVTKAEAIEDLKRLAAAHGNINEKLMNQHGRWSAGLYIRRVGSVAQIRETVGLPPLPKYAYLSEHIRLANEARAAAGQVYREEQLLDGLRQLLAEKGRLDTKTIIAAKGVANPNTYIRRFGSMAEVYRLIGYKPDFAQQRALQICVTRAANSNRETA